MKFLIFLYHVISIWATISWVYNTYKIGKYSELISITGIPERAMNQLRTRGWITAIYVIYWFWFIFIK